MSVYAFKTRKKICCKNVPEMHLWCKISKKKKKISHKNFRVDSLFQGSVGKQETQNLFHPA